MYQKGSTPIYRLPKILLGLSILAILLAGCSAWGERPWLNAPGWSRAKLLGNTFSTDPALLTLDEAGDVYAFIVEKEGDQFKPHVIALDGSGEILWDRVYHPDLIRPRRPKIVWDRVGLSLFWLSDQKLYHMGLDSSGEISSEPVLLSSGSPVDSYDVALGSNGDFSVWYAGPRGDPGLYALSLSEGAVGAVLIDPEGIRPVIHFDDQGTLYAVWANYPEGYGENRLFYSRYPMGEIRQGQEQAVADLRIGVSSVMEGPAFGIDDGFAYVLWTVRVQTGLDAGLVETKYIYFPLDQPTSTPKLQEVFVPVEYHLPYQQTVDTALQAGARVSLVDANFPSTFQISDLAFNDVQFSELVATFNAKTEYLRRKEQWQIGTLFFDAGTPSSYQLLSFTSVNSRVPYVLSDQEGYLYVTWIENSDDPGSYVFFATSAPGFRKALNVITGIDISQLVAETLFGLVSGVVLLPLGLVWILAAGIVIGLTSWMRKEDESITSPTTIISLVLALIAYWAAKLFILPAILSYVPFSAWIPFIPGWLEMPLRIGVPAIIAILAAFITLRNVYGGKERSPIFLVMIYGSIDGLLTLAVYGVHIWGAA
jgi:hypothetical protein